MDRTRKLDLIYALFDLDETEALFKDLLWDAFAEMMLLNAPLDASLKTPAKPAKKAKVIEAIRSEEFMENAEVIIDQLFNPPLNEDGTVDTSMRFDAPARIWEALSSQL